MEKKIDEAPTSPNNAEGSESEVDEAPELQPASPDVDIPTARELRRNYEMGREVNRRLADLEAEDDSAATARTGLHRPRGKRSGAARTVQDTVVRDIDWPHFHIYTTPGAEPMTYERLSIAEFVYGFLHMVDQPDARLDRGVMWDILKGMMEDATEYPWHNVRNFYWIVGSHVENDRLSWADFDQIQKLRIKHAQKHDALPKKPQTQAAQGEKLRYCALYQKGTCPEKSDHAGQKHICGFCYRVKGTPYVHAEIDCRRKNGDEQPKNSKGGE